MPTSFISLVIANRNHERFIEQALGSVRIWGHLFDGRKISAVDAPADSNPGSLAKYSNLNRIFLKTDSGQSSAFNFGIPRRRGKGVVPRPAGAIGAFFGSGMDALVLGGSPVEK
jgi:hypothetical protein